MIKLKTIVVGVLAFLMVPTLAFSVDIPALLSERDVMIAGLKAIGPDWDSNEAVRATLEQKKSDLEWTASKVDQEIAKFNQDVEALDAQFATQRAKLNSHSSRCTGTFDSQSYVDSCNNEADALNSHSDYLQSEADYQNQQEATIKDLIANQNREEAKLQVKIDKYNARRQELISAGLQIKARLDEIQGYLDSCRTAIDSNNLEAMKSECGKMFDGN